MQIYVETNFTCKKKRIFEMLDLEPESKETGKQQSNSRLLVLGMIYLLIFKGKIILIILIIYRTVGFMHCMYGVLT